MNKEVPINFAFPTMNLEPWNQFPIGQVVVNSSLSSGMRTTMQDPYQSNHKMLLLLIEPLSWPQIRVIRKTLKISQRNKNCFYQSINWYKMVIVPLITMILPTPKSWSECAQAVSIGFSGFTYIQDNTELWSWKEFFRWQFSFHQLKGWAR